MSTANKRRHRRTASPQALLRRTFDKAIYLDAQRPYPDDGERWVARIRNDEGARLYQESRTRWEAELFLFRHGGRRNIPLRRFMCLETAIACFIERLPDDLDVLTVRQYLDALRGSLLEVIPGHTEVSSLTKVDYHQVLAHARTKRWNEETLYRRFTTIRMFTTEALVMRFTSTEPVGDIVAALHRKRARRLPVVPTEAHLPIIRGACGPCLRLAVSLMTIEGMEPTELARALRKDVCFASGTIFIRHNPSGHSPGDAPGRTLPMSPQSRTDAVRWMAISAGGPEDRLFADNFRVELYSRLTRVQRQLGLLRRNGKNDRKLPLYLPCDFPYRAAQMRAEAGQNLLTITRACGYADVTTMHRRVGYLIEAKAHARNDRALVRAARRSK